MQLTITAAELQAIHDDWTDWHAQDAPVVGSSYYPEAGMFGVFGLTLLQMATLLQDRLEGRPLEPATLLLLTKDTSDETGVMLVQTLDGSGSFWLDLQGNRWDNYMDWVTRTR
jgi:hypothetical protein